MRAALQCHALLVGINRYQVGITGLQTAAGDAQAVADLLAAQHGYQVRCLTDDEATSDAIVQGLASAAQTLTEESGFLLYFAGHGVALGDGSDGPQGYLLAADARATDESTWLSMDVVRHAIEQLPCRHVLVVLDCCFAGSFRWSSSRDAVLVGHPLYDSQFARYLDGEAWQALTSAAHDQRAADTLPGRRNTRDAQVTQQHSPFAAALLRGLAGGADTTRANHPPDGVITATELYQFLFEELTPADARSNQTPGLWPLRPSNAGEYIFLNPAAALNTLPDPPLDEANNPWLGLRAYSAAEAGLFFGRRRVVAALLARVNAAQAPSLLVVVGASGTGKSSVVKAGLLPALQAVNADAPAWTIIHAPRLRAEPIGQLDEALQRLPKSRPGERQLLLFDQFEELYTQCRDARHRQRFLQALRALVDRADGPLVVLTLRSDFEPRLAACTEFSDLLPSARFLVPTFNNAEMREIIAAPLQAKALYFDPPSLVDTLLDEVAAMPGALPLLSFALAEIYRHAELRRRRTGATDRSLSTADFAATGGVVGALHRRASALYAEADAATQRSMARAFLRMVSQEGARLTRRRVSMDELTFADSAEQARVGEVIDLFVAARLLVIDEQFIEPAHDTLVVAWEQLQDWLAATQSLGLMRALWRAARDWQADGHTAGLLWDNDPRLPQALSLSAELNQLEQRFVRASESRKRRRRRVLIAVTVATMAVLLVTALFALESATEATEQAEIAKQQTLLAEQQLAQAQFAEGRAVLASAQQSLTLRHSFGAATSAAAAIGYRHFGIDISAAGKSAGEPGVASDGESDAEQPPRLIDPARSEYVEAINTLTDANLASLRPVAWRALVPVAMGADGDLLAGLTRDQTLEVRDFSAKQIHLLTGVEGQLQTLLFSPDAGLLAGTFIDAKNRWRVALWKAEAGWDKASMMVLDMPLFDKIIAIHFDAEGQRLAVATANEVALWHLSSSAAPRLQRLAVGRSQGVSRQTSIAFSPDGQSLLVGGWHNRLTRYRLPPSSPLDAQPSALRGTALGPEWTRWSENVQKGDFVNGIAFLPDGDSLLIASANQIQLASVTGDEVHFDERDVFTTNLEIRQLAVSPDGSLLVFEDGAIISLLNLPSLEAAGLIWPLKFSVSQITSLQFFDEGRLLLIGGQSEMEIIDVAGINGADYALVPGDLPAELAPVSGHAERLRALIANGTLDPIRLAFPDPETRPQALQWQLDDDEDGLIISFTDPTADADSQDHGSLQLSLQPGDARVVAVGISKFAIRNLRGGDSGSIELVSIADHELVFAYTLSDEEWGLDRMRFNDAGDRLLLKVSNFDGEIISEYAFATAQPDLLLYLNPQPCQPPVNLPDSHWLMQTQLLDCAAVLP